LHWFYFLWKTPDIVAYFILATVSSVARGIKKTNFEEKVVSRLAQMRQKGKAGDKRKVSTPIKTEPDSPPGRNFFSKERKVKP